MDRLSSSSDPSAPDRDAAAATPPGPRRRVHEILESAGPGRGPAGRACDLAQVARIQLYAAAGVRASGEPRLRA